MPGYIKDGDKVLLKFVNGAPVDADAPITDWITEGVPSLKGVTEGDTITEVETLVPPDDPLFWLAVIEEAEKRGWEVIPEDPDPLPKMKSLAEDLLWPGAVQIYSDGQDAATALEKSLALIIKHPGHADQEVHNPHGGGGKSGAGKQQSFFHMGAAAKFDKKDKKADKKKADEEEEPVWKDPKEAKAEKFAEKHATEHPEEVFTPDKAGEVHELNGVPFNDAPPDFWLSTPDKPIDEPPFKPKMAMALGDEDGEPMQKKAGAGVVMVEPDGRVWLVEPSNHFGGYVSTFPKGGQEPGLSLQQTALKEVFEESGLQAEITGHLGDFEGDLSSNRYYVGKRVGGNPYSTDFETASVRLVDVGTAKQLLNRSRDQKILGTLLDKAVGKSLIIKNPGHADQHEHDPNNGVAAADKPATKDGESIVRKPPSEVFAGRHIVRETVGTEKVSNTTKAGKTTTREVPVYKFTWSDTGKPIPEKEATRLRGLVPPGVTGVRINPDPNGHIQAVWIDAKGRTQPKYSKAHTGAAAVAKFERLKEFNENHPKMLKQIGKDMQSDDKVTSEAAAVAYLIAKTAFRVGGTGNTQADKKAYGASTLLGKHVTVTGNKVTFHFTGKKGVDIRKTVVDAKLADMMRERKGKPNEPLFHSNAGNVRKYMDGISNGKFSPKDFRTYHATATALEFISKKSEVAPDEKTFGKWQKEVAIKVAQTLGNTPSVSLNSYISPLVWDRWRKPEWGPWKPKSIREMDD